MTLELTDEEAAIVRDMMQPDFESVDWGEVDSSDPLWTLHAKLYPGRVDTP